MLLLRPTVDDRISREGSYGFDRGEHHRPRFHQGIDIPVGVGTPLLASGVGVVVEVGNTGSTSGFGLFVKVEYGREAVLTAHMSRADVKRRDAVTATTQLGVSGGKKGKFGAGASEGPHVHVERYLNGTRVDPTNLVSRTSAAGTRLIIATQREEDEMTKVFYQNSLEGWISYAPGMVYFTKNKGRINQWLDGLGLPILPSKANTGGSVLLWTRPDAFLPSFLLVTAGYPAGRPLVDGEVWTPHGSTVDTAGLVAGLVGPLVAALNAELANSEGPVLVEDVIARLKPEFDKLSANFDE